MSSDAGARRVRLWSILVIAGVFLAGAVAGAGLFAWLRPPPHKWRPHRPDLPALFSELELTPDQREKATAIFDKHRAAVESILKASFPRVRAEEEQSQRELRTILTDAQQKKLDEIEARPRPPHRRRGFGKGFPSPGEPGERESAGGPSAPPDRTSNRERAGEVPPPSPTR